MKKEITMEEEAKKKNKGWSFVDDGKGVTVTNMPSKTKKALLKARLEKEWEEDKKKKEKKGK